MPGCFLCGLEAVSLCTECNCVQSCEQHYIVHKTQGKLHQSISLYSVCKNNRIRFGPLSSTLRSMYTVHSAFKNNKEFDYGYQKIMKYADLS